MTTSNVRPNIYQLSGLDEKERGFTRQVECTCLAQEYQAVLRYERVKVEEHSQTDETSALQKLIETLQHNGYTQLRSQLIFRGETYLGSQELWVEYPDVEYSEEESISVVERFRQWFFRKKQQKPNKRSLGQC